MTDELSMTDILVTDSSYTGRPRDIFNVVSINSLSGLILMASNSLLPKQSACTFADSVKHI